MVGRIWDILWTYSQQYSYCSIGSGVKVIIDRPMLGPEQMAVPWIKMEKNGRESLWK